MLYAYIGAAVAVGALIGLTALSVSRIANQVTENVRERSVYLLSFYDELIRQKREKLQEIEQKIEEKGGEIEERAVTAAQGAESASAPVADVMKTIEQISSSEYMDSTAASAYRQIRKGFSRDVLKTLDSLNISPEGRGEGRATKLVNSLSGDSIYKLSVYPQEVQQELLEEILQGEDLELLDEYKGNTKSFNAIGFYDWLKSRAASEPGRIKLYVSKTEEAGEYPDYVDVTVDEDICEGFIIEADNTVYDYCIKGKEIS